jgi:hypothetical protein
MTKQFDPHWPFPQFDEEGVQLLPAEFDPEPVAKDWPWDIEEALF